MLIQYLVETKVLQVCPCKYTIGAYVTPSMAAINYKPREKNERIVIRVAFLQWERGLHTFHIFVMLRNRQYKEIFSHVVYYLRSERKARAYG
jgi:hypothetical protein